MPRAGRRFPWPTLLFVAILSTAVTTRPATAQPFSTGPWLAIGEIDDVPPLVFRGDSAEIITGPGVGEPPLVRIFRVTQVPPSSGDPVGPGFLAYDESFLGGVRVATCDLAPGPPPLPPTPQPTRKILTGPGPGMEPRLRVFSVDPNGLNPTMLADFLAFAPDLTGGVFVACGDVDGDGVDEIIAGTGAGDGAVVRVFKLNPGGWATLYEFTAFIRMAALPAGLIEDRTRVIMTYALCGFANIASVGINVAGYSVLVPERRREVMGMVWKAMLAGFLATCLTASIVGLMPTALFGR